MIRLLRPTQTRLVVHRRLRLADRCLACGLLVIAGCITSRTTTHVEHGTRIDPRDVAQIVIGQTTRSEIFQEFGTPQSMFRDRADLFRFESVGFYSYAQNRVLTTFAEGQYALLYRFDQADTRTRVRVLVFPFVVSAKTNKEAYFTGDELLIFLDTNTNVVTDVAAKSAGPGQ